MNNRLQAELQRLYPVDSAGGSTRAALLELARPADWEALAPMWRSLQADLALPATAIALNGLDGYQLWFSFADALPVAQVAAFLEALRARHLAHIKGERLLLTPKPDGVPPVPRQTQEDHFSAFVAPDLAPVFGHEPWVDLQPTAEGQADLLSRLKPIKTVDFRHALEQLGVAPLTVQAAFQPATGTGQDPRAFLLKVMNDETVALALRIDAAKALL